MLPIQCEGFKEARRKTATAPPATGWRLVGTGATDGIGNRSINILGDFNLAGETWMIRDYYERIGVEVVATITGDGRVDAIRRAHGATLNVVQCSGSMIHLAKSHGRERTAFPSCEFPISASRDMSKSLYGVGDHLR